MREITNHRAPLVIDTPTSQGHLRDSHIHSHFGSTCSFQVLTGKLLLRVRSQTRGYWLSQGGPRRGLYQVLYPNYNFSKFLLTKPHTKRPAPRTRILFPLLRTKILEANRSFSRETFLLPGSYASFQKCYPHKNMWGGDHFLFTSLLHEF